MIKQKKQSNGLTDVPGFLAAGVHCDIRQKNNGRLDLAVIYSQQPAHAAGVFTKNAFAAAPVLLGRKMLAEQKEFHGIIANSGNANACTGPQGMKDSLQMQRLLAAVSEHAAESFFVCSTGRIGEALPMDKVATGIDLSWSGLSEKATAGQAAADAILTSDTRRKVVTLQIQTSKGLVTLSGMAKGAGMIEPNMATMLAFFATDAGIATASLQKALVAAVEGSFNAVTVDGDRSTNDTVLVLANGASGIDLGPRSGADWTLFVEALKKASHLLAAQIVGDGEKITKVVDVSIEGAKSAAQAEKVARAIGNSLLVKSSWYGNDPNWGRVLDVVGYAAEDLNPDKVTMAYRKSEKHQAVPVFANGAGIAKNKARWKKIVLNRRFRIELNLGAGRAGYRLLASDLTEGYVNFNKSE